MELLHLEKRRQLQRERLRLTLEHQAKITVTDMQLLGPVSFRRGRQTESPREKRHDKAALQNCHSVHFAAEMVD